MTLLEDIQRSAVDARSDLGTLLRKCKLLGARLGSKPLEDWLVWESNGYPDNIQVPEYRVWSLEVKGHFTGYFGSGIRNAPIPNVSLPEGVREFYSKWECRMSIATVENAVETIKTGSVHIGTGDLALRLGTTVYQDQNCLQAWAEFSPAHLVELLNNVRNRILDFSLALWKQEPLAGETTNAATQLVDASNVTQIFNTTVYGGAANLVGNAHESSVSFHILTNDFASLEKVLLENGLKNEDLTELRTALDADIPPSSSKSFGTKVSSWIAAMTEKAATGTWKIGLSTAGSLLEKAITKYYGL